MQKSEVWRISGSPIARIEGANILRSLERVVKGLDANIPIMFAVENAPSSHTDGETIWIEPARYLNAETKPIPSTEFDILVGYAIHEAAHCVSRSLEVHKRSDPLYQIVASLGEEYVADNFYQGVAKAYIQNARQAEIGGRLPPYTETGNVVLDAMSAFVHIVMYNDLVSMSDEVATVFTILSKHMGQVGMREEPLSRIAVYELLTTALEPYWKKAVKKQEAEDRLQGSTNGARERATANNVAERKIRDEVADTLELADIQEKGERLTDKEYRVILDSLNTEERDVTSVLQQLTDETVTRTLEKNADGEHTVKPDAEMLEALSSLRIAIDRHGYTRERFRPKGRVDKSRLHRLAVDDTLVFRRQKRQPIKPRQIWLLLDGSGSMSDREGQYLYRVAAAFQARIPDARVYCYGGYPEVVLVRADRGGALVHVEPNGNTASGNAVLYTAYELHKAGGGTLIHVTDGEPNAGISLQGAFATVEKETSVSVVNLMPKRTSYKYDGIASPRVTNISYQKGAGRTFGDTIVNKLKEVWGLH